MASTRTRRSRSSGTACRRAGCARAGRGHRALSTLHLAPEPACRGRHRAVAGHGGPDAGEARTVGSTGDGRGHVPSRHRPHLRARVPGVQHDRQPPHAGRPGSVLRERSAPPRRRRAVRSSSAGCRPPPDPDPPAGSSTPSTSGSTTSCSTCAAMTRSPKSSNENHVRDRRARHRVGSDQAATLANPPELDLIGHASPASASRDHSVGWNEGEPFTADSWRLRSACHGDARPGAEAAGSDAGVASPSDAVGSSQPPFFLAYSVGGRRCGAVAGLFAGEHDRDFTLLARIAEVRALLNASPPGVTALTSFGRRPRPTGTGTWRRTF